MKNKPLVVYLDQNKWIDLYQNRGNKYDGLIQLMKTAIQNGIAVFPLSDMHILETQKISDIEHRKSLARFMVSVSRGVTLAPSHYIAKQQVLSAVDRWCGVPNTDHVEVLGQGVFWSFGTTEDPASYFKVSKEKVEAVMELLSTPQGLFNTMIGFGEDNVSKSLSNYGTGMSAVVSNVENLRNQFQKEGAPVFRRAKLATAILSYAPLITERLKLHGKTLDEFMDSGKSGMTRFVKDVPVLHVEAVLDAERDIAWNRDIQVNDMTDRAFLSAAIPSCDIVVTEKFWVNIARRNELDATYGTEISSDLASLEKRLNELATTQGAFST